jgi:hypothetical protein
VGEPLHALDHDRVGARTFDPRPHRNEEVREIDDFRLACRILDHRFALGERRGHHQVLGAGDRDRLEHETRTLQALGARPDVTVLDMNIGAHGLQTRHVDVDRAGTDGAAARQRHVCVPKPRHQRPEHEYRGAHRLDELVGREVLAYRRRIDFDAHALIDGHAHAHASEQLDRRGHVLEMRNVADRHRTVGQQRAGENRQGGVFRSGDADLALERGTAVDLQFIHAQRAPPPIACHSSGV